MTAQLRLDKQKIRRSFAAAAGRYDDFASLQREVGTALLEMFPPESSSGAMLDIGCGTGFLTRQLAARHRGGLLAMDIAMPMLEFCRQKNAAFPVDYLCADAEKLPFAAHGFGQIYSNLAFQWCQDLSAVFADCKRILAVGGQLAFATFGPATLRELKTAWAAVDAYPHVNEFYGIDAIERFLRQAGFSSIYGETALYQSRYKSVTSLMRELKGIGAHNVQLGRNKKPTTRRQLQRMIESYPLGNIGGEVLASYEIIFIRARV